MLDRTFLNSNVEAITTHIATVKNEIKMFKDGDREFLEKYESMEGLSGEAQRLLAELPAGNVMTAADETLRLVREMRNRLERPEKEQLQGLAVLALNSVAVLEAEFDMLDDRVTTAFSARVPMLRSVWNRIKSIIAKAIKAINKHLWQIISTALTLKEWSVKGSVGSGIFGLASVEMSLTFGK